MGHGAPVARPRDCVPSEPSLALVAHSPLLNRAYVRADRPWDRARPAGTPARLKVLREVAMDVGAKHNQVVLSWLIGGDAPTTPLVHHPAPGRAQVHLPPDRVQARALH